MALQGEVLGLGLGESIDYRLIPMNGPSQVLPPKPKRGG